MSLWNLQKKDGDPSSAPLEVQRRSVGLFHDHFADQLKQMNLVIGDESLKHIEQFQNNSKEFHHQIDKFLKLQDSQYQNQLFISQFQQNKEDDNQRFYEQSQKIELISDMEKRIKKENKRASLKNFLIFIKRCIIRLYFSDLSDEKNIKVQNFLQLQNKTSRKQFQDLFNVRKIRKLLTRMFTSKSLQRQIQTSRMTRQNRKIFRREINLLKKAFIESKFSHL